jgi:hypothetical protein
MKKLKGFVAKVDGQVVKSKNVLTSINKNPKIWDTLKDAERYCASYCNHAEVVPLAECTVIGYAIDNGDTELREILCWKPEFRIHKKWKGIDERGILPQKNELLPVHPHEYRWCFISKKVAIKSMIKRQEIFLKQETVEIRKLKTIIAILKNRLINETKK